MQRSEARRADYRQSQVARRLSRVRLPKITPKMTVGATAALVACLILFGGDIRRALTGGYNPRISFAQGHEETSGRNGRRRAEAQNAVVFDGEVYRTEGRLREASAVAIAASLCGVARGMERRPVMSVDELLAEIGRRNLLPPGIEYVAERKLLVSEHSTIYLRFRPDPFGIEVLSLGRERMDGAGLLVRVPDESDDAQTYRSHTRQRYFYSFRLKNITVPEAFANTSTVRAAGWQTDYFDARLPDGADAEQLAAWTRERANQNR